MFWAIQPRPLDDEVVTDVYYLLELKKMSSIVVESKINFEEIRNFMIDNFKTRF